jgi:PAS domain S-box-containing protein
MRRHSHLFAAFRNSPIAVAVTRDRRFVDVNEAFTRLLGWTAGDVIGRTTQEAGLLTPEVADELSGDLGRDGAVKDRTVTVTTRDGSTRDVLLGASRVEIDGQPHTISTFVDVTAQREVERERRQSDERFHLIADTISEVFWIADVNIETMVYVSPAYERVWGRTCQSLLDDPRSFLNAVHPDDLGRVMQTLEVKQDGRPFDQEFRIVRPDGEVRWIWDRGFPVRRGDEPILHYVGVAQDITERRRREEELRESLERFELVARATDDAVWDFNVKTGKAWWSDMYYEKYGHPRDRPPTFEAWAAHIHPEDRERVTTSFVRVLTGGDQQWREEYRFRRADGTYASVIDRAYVGRDADGVAARFSGVIEDVTEQLNLQRQLNQAAKMEAIGQLAGGVAHDFNNLLTVIQGYASLIVDGDASADIKEHTAEIIGAADRAASLTRQLLLFSRRQVLQRTHFDVNETLRGTGKMLSRIVGEDVLLQFELTPDPVFIDADAGMIDQIVLNLVVNARDAMPSGGVLRIATRVQHVAQPPPSGEAVPGPYVRVTISDTGEGIPPTVLPHIFEPFFSTKAPGRGTGLGLSTIFGIVKQHRGWIDVDTVAGQGTAFHVWLPLSDSQVPASAPEEVTGASKGNETVLLVEDEHSVLLLMRVALEQKGYRILQAASAAEALDVWRAHGHDIRLLVTDMVLPSGIGGGELAARLRHARPALKVLFVSGYNEDFSGKEIKEEPGQNFLQKPFSPATFASRVRACLDARE